MPVAQLWAASWLPPTTVHMASLGFTSCALTGVGGAWACSSGAGRWIILVRARLALTACQRSRATTPSGALSRRTTMCDTWCTGLPVRVEELLLPPPLLLLRLSPHLRCPARPTPRRAVWSVPLPMCRAPPWSSTTVHSTRPPAPPCCMHGCACPALPAQPSAHQTGRWWGLGRCGKQRAGGGGLDRWQLTRPPTPPASWNTSAPPCRSTRA
mmetsp:Transcript_7950/g.20026  ORF Transcript_7950/g.20026 Transcript_7950/m.20026 type:complete len:212 (+) Transcript_7950:407-1042(+)